MRNPLASIRACAELSLTDDLEGVRESAMDIMDETDRLDRWARELLQFSSTNIETPQYLDMNDLVKVVVSEYEPILERAAISLRVKMTESSLPVKANATPLSQVFGNLIMNALEAMDGHGELTIVTVLDSHRNHVIVRFTDNGPGLSKEIQDKLFQPFITTKSTGTGLGLALSRHLVEHYHGNLTIESEPDLGVTVTVSLPITGDPA
jgi:two-component system sensor histidine kinase AtoS